VRVSGDSQSPQSAKVEVGRSYPVKAAQMSDQEIAELEAEMTGTRARVPSSYWDSPDKQER
jgi:hypothetical protein